MGYGVVDSGGSRPRALAHGEIVTHPGQPADRRLLHLHRELSRLLQEWHPDLVAVEELFFGRNVTTALTVGQARGVALLAAAQAGIPVAEYTPMQVKQAVTGWGRAAKEQVQAMVRALLGLADAPRPDDAADALAVALCAAQSWRFEEAVRRAGRGGAG